AALVAAGLQRPELVELLHAAQRLDRAGVLAMERRPAGDQAQADERGAEHGPASDQLVLAAAGLAEAAAAAAHGRLHRLALGPDVLDPLGGDPRRRDVRVGELHRVPGVVPGAGELGAAR